MFRCRWNIIKYFSRVLYGENVDYIQLNIYSFLRNITSLVSFLNIIVAIKSLELGFCAVGYSNTPLHVSLASGWAHREVTCWGVWQFSIHQRIGGG